METLFLALRVLVALGAILAAIWVVQRKVTGKAGGKKAVAARFGSSRKAIQVLGTHRLGAKTSISIVEIDGVKMVLGVTEHGISVLENAPVPLVAAPAAAPIAHPEAIAPESDLTPVAASAVEALATADVPRDPEPVDFAAALREALDEASDAPVGIPAVAAQDQLAPRRRRRAIPALAEQLLPHMTRTLAAGIGLRVDPAPAPQVAAPASPRATAPTGGALAAFLANSTPAAEDAAAEDAAPAAKDYSTAQPLSAHLRVLQRAS